MVVVGLTGGIGTGKTTVSETLAKLGAVIINADKVGHEVMKPNTEVWNDVVATWGQDVLLENQEINRRRLGEIVFNDPADLQKLNQITHPRMFKVMENQIAGYKAEGNNVVVLEAAILIEANWLPLVNQVWVTTAPEEAVIERLQNRNGLSREQVLSRIRSQMPAKERESYGNVLIDTNCSLAEVEERVRQQWESLISSEEVRNQKH